MLPINNKCIFRNKVLASIFITFCCFFFLSICKVWATEYTIKPITDNNYYNDAPSISNGQIAWHGYDGNDDEIFYYDGSQITQLTNNIYLDCYPIISNGQIVWFGNKGNDLNNEIFYYDGSQITQFTNNNYHDSCPNISNGQIVWQGYDGNDDEIFFYDGSQIKQLTNNDYYDSNPSISNGQIAWYGYDGNDYEIFFYDGSQITQLTNNDYNDIGTPSISNGQIAWIGYDGNDYEIFFYDGSQITQLTNNDYDDYNPIISSGQIVWEGGTESNYNDYEIFFYDGSQIKQITNNNYYDGSPSISNGQIAWMGYDGNNYQIFLATSDPILKSVEIYYRHDLGNNGLPIAGYPTSATPVTVKAIVWADDGKDTKPYTQQDEDEIVNDGKWYNTGSEGSQAGKYSPDLTVPVLSVSDVPKIYKWPDSWQQPDFEWASLFNYASSPTSAVPGEGMNRNYVYNKYVNLLWGSWGADNITLPEGNWKFNVKAYLNKGTPEEQFVVSSDTECATRVSVLDSNAPVDSNLKNYLKWITAYYDVPYEWGGYWFGGKEGKDVGGHDINEGYGVDCSGLVSIGAKWAGYNWYPWRANATMFAYGPDAKPNTSDDNYYSIRISPSDLKPGDILNKAGKHVVTIYGIRSRDNMGNPKIVTIISAEPNPYNKVLMQDKDIAVYSTFQARRLVTH